MRDNRWVGRAVGLRKTAKQILLPFKRRGSNMCKVLFNLILSSYLIPRNYVNISWWDWAYKEVMESFNNPNTLNRLWLSSVQFRSVAQSCPTLRPHESQHARPPCPSPTPAVYSNSCPTSRWCHPVISSSVVPFSSCPQSLPVSGSFPTSQLFT